MRVRQFLTSSIDIVHSKPCPLLASLLLQKKSILHKKNSIFQVTHFIKDFMQNIIIKDQFFIEKILEIKLRHGMFKEIMKFG